VVCIIEVFATFEAVLIVLGRIVAKVIVGVTFCFAKGFDPGFVAIFACVDVLTTLFTAGLGGSACYPIVTLCLGEVLGFGFSANAAASEFAAVLVAGAFAAFPFTEFVVGFGALLPLKGVADGTNVLVNALVTIAVLVNFPRTEGVLASVGCDAAAATDKSADNVIGVCSATAYQSGKE
jgi:hypothetical protein